MICGTIGYVKVNGGVQGECFNVFEEFPDRGLIDKAEELILRIRDIQSCRIATDESGKISEIHVVATTDKSPKMLARDVETCLKAQLGIAVDYRKIGVVLIDVVDNDPSTPAVKQEMDDDSYRLATKGEMGGGPFSVDDIVGSRLSESSQEMSAGMKEPVAENKVFKLEFLEDDSRLRFKGLSLTIDESRIDAEVKLERNGIEVVGCLGAFRKAGPVDDTIAGATVHALSELLDESFHLCLAGIEEVAVSGNKALVAAVELIEGRTVRSFSGSAFIGRDANEASVLAVLDAVNRPFGRWKSHREIHYRIR